MKTAHPVDTARVELFLSDLRLPAIKQVWAQLAEQSDKEGWPAARFLAALAEHEIADRGRRRIERHLAEARLPVGKTLDSFDFEAVPMVSKAQVRALTAGDSWLQNGANLLRRAAVKIEPKSPRIRFTRRVHHDSLAQSTISC
jgi:DNA replication protein DnaC